MRINLHINPSEIHLAIFEVVESKHQLNCPHGNKKGNKQSIIWCGVMSSLLNTTEKPHENSLSFFQAEMI
jgi:hypothetical protein